MFVGCPRAAEPGVLSGLCEASTVVPWEGGYLVGDNETPGRLFRFDDQLRPTGEIDLGSEVDDIEALASTADGGVWIVGSQSANKDGAARPSRERIARLGHPAFTPDLSACAPCQAARLVAPNRGGRNVEGAIEIGGHLWLGLRAPLVEGRALLVETDEGRALRTVPVDLGGAGVRELVPWRGGILVVAGPVDDTKAPHTVWWMAGPDAMPTRLAVTLPASTEGLVVKEDGEAIWVSDGDGKADRPCTEPARWGRTRIPAP